MLRPCVKGSEIINGNTSSCIKIPSTKEKKRLMYGKADKRNKIGDREESQEVGRVAVKKWKGKPRMEDLDGRLDEESREEALREPSDSNSNIKYNERGKAWFI